MTETDATSPLKRRMKRRYLVGAAVLLALLVAYFLVPKDRDPALVERAAAARAYGERYLEVEQADEARPAPAPAQ